MRWRASDIRFVLVDDATGGPVLTVAATTPAGTILVMGEPVVEDRTLRVMACMSKASACTRTGSAP